MKRKGISKYKMAYFMKIIRNILTLSSYYIKDIQLCKKQSKRDDKGERR